MSRRPGETLGKYASRKDYRANAELSLPFLFKTFFREAMDSDGALIATDSKDGQVIGSSRFHGYNDKASEIEIGWNLRSQKALERIGGVRVGSRRDGSGRDSIVYRITASTFVPRVHS
jgi:RimJ/RimL family protein N-acetyltransferase